MSALNPYILSDTICVSFALRGFHYEIVCYAIFLDMRRRFSKNERAPSSQADGLGVSHHFYFSFQAVNIWHHYQIDLCGCIASRERSKFLHCNEKTHGEADRELLECLHGGLTA